MSEYGGTIYFGILSKTSFIVLKEKLDIVLLSAGVVFMKISLNCIRQQLKPVVMNLALTSKVK